MANLQSFTAELVYIDDELRHNQVVVVDSAAGIIVYAGPAARTPPDAPPARSLGHVALLPGMINCHSHAFQLGLRGRAEREYDAAVQTDGATDDFWTWRAEMYKLVGAMDEQRMLDLTTAAFREMVRGGCTAVGE